MPTTLPAGTVLVTAAAICPVRKEWCSRRPGSEAIITKA